MKQLLISLFMLTPLLSSAQDQPCAVDLEKTWGVCAQLEWLSGPSLNLSPRDQHTSNLQITFWKASPHGHLEQVPVPDTLLVRPWMSMSGHGHSTYYEEERTEMALELTEMLFRDMGGFWWVLQFYFDEDRDGVISPGDKLVRGHVIDFEGAPPPSSPEPSHGGHDHDHHHH